MFLKQNIGVSDCFMTGKQPANGCLSNILNMMCILIGTKSYVNIKLEHLRFIPPKAKYEGKMKIF